MVSPVTGRACVLSGSHEHHHDHDATSARNEARTRWVVALTCAMMVGELAVGYFTRSLALTADGWHMATHAGALGMAALAYWFARTRSSAAQFSFGTGKVHALAGYTSAVALALVALWMMSESVQRLVRPVTIAFTEALPVAVLGLAVNLASIKLLHAEDHEHHDDDGDHHHHDHNLRAAYVHVLADAFTSLLAIVALLGGRYLGWAFLDPLMGIVGGIVIARWSWSLCRGAARQLLDVVPSARLAEKLRAHLEAIEGTHVVDLHIWQIGPRTRACIVSVVSSTARSPAEYREHLRACEPIEHVTIEVHAATPAAVELSAS